MTLSNIKDNTPNQATVDLLKSLLAAAESGELRSIITVQGYDNNGVNHSWSIDKRNSRRMMLSEIVMLQHDFTVNIGPDEKDSVLAAAIYEF